MTKRKASVPPLTDEQEARIQAGIAQDPDNPEITAGQFARMRPAREVLPAGLYQALMRRGRPPAADKAVPVTLRVPPAVLAAYKAGGPGWQTRMNEALARGARPTYTRRDKATGPLKGVHVDRAVESVPKVSKVVFHGPDGRVLHRDAQTGRLAGPGESGAGSRKKA